MKKLLIGTSLLFSLSALAACGSSQSPDDANTETVPQEASKAPNEIQDSQKAAPPTEPDMAGSQNSEMEDAETKPAAKSVPAPAAKTAKPKAVPSPKPAPVIPEEKVATPPEADPHAGHDMKDM